MWVSEGDCMNLPTCHYIGPTGNLWKLNRTKFKRLLGLKRSDYLVLTVSSSTQYGYFKIQFWSEIKLVLFKFTHIFLVFCVCNSVILVLSVALKHIFNMFVTL